MQMDIGNHLLLSVLHRICLYQTLDCGFSRKSRLFYSNLSPVGPGRTIAKLGILNFEVPLLQLDKRYNFSEYLTNAVGFAAWNIMYNSCEHISRQYKNGEARKLCSRYHMWYQEYRIRMSFKMRDLFHLVGRCPEKLG